MAIINLINGLFGADHPLNSTAEYPNTETVSKKLRRLMSDTIVIIGGTHVYHLEAEIGSEDESIVVRVFEYGFMEGLRTKTTSEDGSHITIKFPNVRIIYWETTKTTPDEVTLTLCFPNGEHYNYVVRTVKFLSHTIEELEAQKLVILLPFYVLKLRKQTVSARTSERREELAKEIKPIVEELVATADRAEQTGLMSASDKRIVLEHMERLYKELFGQYDEFKEADVVLQDRIRTYSEEAAEKAKTENKFEVAQRMLARGMALSEIAEIVQLPIEKLQT